MATAESVKAKLQGLIAKANEVTGNTHTDLTTAINALIAGYGTGEVVKDPTLLTDLAEYFRTPTQEVVEAVNSYDDSILSFVVLTDTHGDGNKQHSQAIVNYLLENSKADKCFWLGDVCNGPWNPEEFERYVEPLLKNRSKIFFAVGNHEYNHDGGYTDMSLLVEYLTAQRNPTDNFNFYHDDAKHKVRYIVVDTERQGFNRTWIDNAINTRPSGYKYLVFGHEAVGYTDGTTGENGVPWTRTTDGAISLSIMENSPQDCVGYFHGDEHVDAKHIVRDKYWEVCFTCDEFDNTNWYPGYAFTDRVAGTVTEQAVSVVSINLETGEVVVRRIGAGSGYTYNWVVANAPHRITNQLTNVTSSSSVTSVENGHPYTAQLTADSGYTINSVMVTMGGVDITATAYSNGTVSIASVTGDVVIVANAVVDVSYTEEGYIGDGLTWHVDGINNTGNGHSSTATEWVDLVNGNNLTMLNPAMFSWDDKCLVNSGSIVYHAGVPVDGLTVEMVFQNTREAAHNYIATFAMVGSGASHILSLHNSDSATFLSTKNQYTNLGVSYLDKMAVTIVYGSANGDAERVYVNGQLLPALHNASLSDSWSSPLYAVSGVSETPYLKIGGYQNGGGNYGMTGNIYSFRAYNRQLTTDEVQKNYAVDVERFFAGGGGDTEATYTAEGYLANDLTWQFDGINNTGNGHSSTATEWVDLVEGRTMSVADTANLSWGDKCLTMTQAGYVYHDNELVDALTVEMVFHNKREQNPLMVATFAAAQVSGSTSPVHVLTLSNKNSASFISTNCNFTNLGVSYTDKMAVTIVYSSKTSDAERVYVNGQLLEELHNSSYSDAWGNSVSPASATEGYRYLKFGKYRDAGTYDMAGDIYSFRAYNRQLTTEEVQANYAVDVQRFGLAN